jgi:hypothetical protein
MRCDDGIKFADDKHKSFYMNQYQKLRPDIYLKSLIYTLGICYDTRRNFDVIYDTNLKEINPDAIYASWQTGSSLKVTRLAFQLFTDNTPSAFNNGHYDNFNECKQYCVSDIFCCSFAPYFVEAVRLRYHEYFSYLLLP